MLAVAQVGTGESLASTGNPLTILFIPGVTSPTPVSVPISTSGSTALIENGNATAEASLTLSEDKRYLTFMGYNRSLPNTTLLSASTSLAIHRVIGQVDANKLYTLVASSSTAFSTNSPRGAATDGNGNYWGIGLGTSSALIYFGNQSAQSSVVTGITTRRLRL